MLFFSSYLLHNILFKWEKWTPQILIIWVKNNQNIFWCSSPLLSIILPAHNSPLFSNLSCLFPKHIRLWACRWVWAVVFFCWLLPQRVDDMEHISEDSIIPTPQFQCLEAQGVFPFDDPSSSSSGSGSVLHYPHSGKEPCECSIHCLESPFQRERLRQVTVSLKLLSRNDLNHSLHLAGKASHLAKANFKGQEIVSTDLKETHRYLQNNINNYCKVHSQSEDGTILYGCMISTKKHDPSWDLSF